MSGCALFQMATTWLMSGTQVQNESVTFWPAALDAAAATSTAASAGAEIRAALRQPPGSRAPRRPRSRLESFIAPPRNESEAARARPCDLICERSQNYPGHNHCQDLKMAATTPLFAL